MFVTAGRARTTRKGEDFDAAGHLSRAVFDESGVSHEADVYLCGPTVFMADMKVALATFVVPPAQIHAEIFKERVDIAGGGGRSDAKSASAQG